MQPLRPGDGRLVCRERPAGSPGRQGRRRNCSRNTRTAHPGLSIYRDAHADKGVDLPCSVEACFLPSTRLLHSRRAHAPSSPNKRTSSQPSTCREPDRLKGTVPASGSPSNPRGYPRPRSPSPRTPPSRSPLHAAPPHAGRSRRGPPLPPASVRHLALIEDIYRDAYLLTTLRGQELLRARRKDELDKIVSDGRLAMAEALGDGSG